MDAGRDLEFKVRADIKPSPSRSSAVAGMDIELTAGRDMRAKRFNVATSGNTGNATLDIQVGGDLDLTGADLRVIGKDSGTWINIEVDGELKAQSAFMGVYATRAGSESLVVTASGESHSFRGATLKADEIDIETCKVGAGCVQDPHLDLRKLKFLYTSDSFCIDGEDVEDVTDVTLQTVGKKPLNGC